jgi:hypothetical protein
VKPACEALDDRQLLTTGVSAATLAVLSPPSAAVANAAAILDSLSPTAFTQFESDLAKAESRSRVTPAQLNALAQDEVTLNQMIQSAGLHPRTSLGSLNLQDVVDDALKDTPSEAASQRAPLDRFVAGVPGGTQLVRRTVAQMQVVARAARVSPQVHDALSADWHVFEDDLGPHPDTDLGPGATDRDPLEVFYNGQVANYVK